VARSRLLAPLLALLVLADPAGATWSIVCVNRRTREVGVATATCIPDFNLRGAVPILVVGKGGGAAQSVIDMTGESKRLIANRFLATDETPAEILAELEARDPDHERRQYGIVNFTGDPATFTGALDGHAASGVTGEVGDYLYAIQGNVLTGDEVVLAAEAAFRSTKGDMGQRIMAAMEAARALGGDGRCSCTFGNPIICGVPPPDFVKSAHVGCVLVARIGDANGTCSRSQGCATGSYYLGLNVIHGEEDPDPVFTLQKRYDAWRRRLAGRVDGIHSHVAAKPLPADGVSVHPVLIELRDVDDLPVLHGGAQISITTADGLPALSEVGPVVDHGNGRYSFTLRAGRRTGVDRFVLRVSDVAPMDPSNVVTATLWPYLEVPVLPAGLFLASEPVSSSRGGSVPFALYLPEKAGAAYLLVAELARARLARPGRLPLSLGRSPFFPAAPARRDARGWSDGVLELAPDELRALVGCRIAVAGLVLDGSPLERTNRVGFLVVP
jgi:uncharacterized Ntn-hydrolase superfamily protein